MTDILLCCSTHAGFDTCIANAVALNNFGT